jgi:t-SNARE complex subunit (syntaxin)
MPQITNAKDTTKPLIRVDPEVGKKQYSGQELQDQKLEATKKTLGEITDLMGKNIQLVIERGERIETTCEKTEQLVRSADSFRIGSKRLRRNLMIQNLKKNAAIILIICTIIGLIIFAIYISTK